MQALAAYPSEVRQARRTVRARLRHWGRRGVEEPVALCLTEMLTNVAKHTGSLACVVTLEDTGDGVRLTVSDTSTDLPVVRECDWTAESGRGMRLIAAVAASFGCTVTGAGKDVWARFHDHSPEAVA